MALPAAKDFDTGGAISRELGAVGKAWVRHALVGVFFGVPLRLGRALVSQSQLAASLEDEQVFDLLGDALLSLFDALGPLYGKAGQILLSRLSPGLHQFAQRVRLTRLYDDWPPVPFAAVRRILDDDIPGWREELRIEPVPLGVASMAQVHGAKSLDGREWVIKVIKPQARKRILESMAALDDVLDMVEPLAVTRVSQRLVREASELSALFKREVSLSRERDTIRAVRQRLGGAKQGILRIPATYDAFCTDSVLVVERFRGTPLSAVCDGSAQLSTAQRQKLARRMLSELLVQVFELGLFHADPHAGNLMLLEDGSVGLFDWGLAGELLESDRKHIAGMLRAVIAVDIERLVDVLVAMAADGGGEVAREACVAELEEMSALVKKRENGKRASLREVLETGLGAADRLGIPLPEGLLLMAKSLLTIEGLARGIAPDVSLARVAAPVLWRAARPGMKDFWALAKKLPTLARSFK